MSRIVVIVPPETAGQRLDRIVAAVPEVHTRSQAKQLIDAGRVLIGGVVRKAGYLVRAGERIDIERAPAPSRAIEPEAVPLSVLYEDADLIAIDKPPGMVVHPAPGARQGTLVHALAHRFGPLAGVGAPDRPGIVHRLDRDTSGVLLVARTVAALEGLARQFRDRTIDKRYLAVVRGQLARPRGTIDRPIGRHPHERKRMSVHSRRPRPALTRYEVVERLKGATLVRLFPKTGRTHQLRVHLAAVGHPIVGDKVYGGSRGASAREPCPRQALHAEEIRFLHPRTGVSMGVRAPLARDVEELLAALRQAPETTAKSRGSA